MSWGDDLPARGLPDCRALSGLGDCQRGRRAAPPGRARGLPAPVDQLHAQGTGSANRVERMYLLVEPPRRFSKAR